MCSLAPLPAVRGEPAVAAGLACGTLATVRLLSRHLEQLELDDTASREAFAALRADDTPTPRTRVTPADSLRGGRAESDASVGVGAEEAEAPLPPGRTRLAVTEGRRRRRQRRRQQHAELVGGLQAHRLPHTVDVLEVPANHWSELVLLSLPVAAGSSGAAEARSVLLVGSFDGPLRGVDMPSARTLWQVQVRGTALAASMC